MSYFNSSAIKSNSTAPVTITAYVISLSVILLITFILGIIFNLISILTILIARAFQPINILILNLATADLVYIIGVPLFLVHVFSKSWPFGLIGCQVFFLTDFIGMIVGVYTIVALSVERYFDIADAKRRLEKFSEKSKLTFIVLCITFIWLFAFLFSLPMVVNIKLEKRNKSVSCETNWNEQQINAYFMSKFIFIFIVPCFLIMFSSIRILQFLNRWRKSSLNRKLTLDRLISLKYQNNRRSMRKASSLNAIKLESSKPSSNNVTWTRTVPTNVRKSVIKMSIRKQSALVAPSNKERKQSKPRSNSSNTEFSSNFFHLEKANEFRHRAWHSMPVIKNEFDRLNSSNLLIQPNKQVFIYCPKVSVPNSGMIPLVEDNRSISENQNSELLREKKRNVFKRSLKKIIPHSYRSKMRRKASRIVLMIVFMFLIQWIPLWLFHLYNTFSNTKIKYIQLVNVIITLISYSNSIANPALYMFLTYNFKKNCRIIFHQRPFKKIGYLSSTLFFATENKLKLNQFV